MTEGKGILGGTKSGENRKKRIPSGEWSVETQRTSYYVTKYQEKRKLQKKRMNSIPPDFYQRNEVFLLFSEKNEHQPL